MFGLATKEDIEALEARFEGLRKAVADKSKDLSTKLYTVEVFNPGGNKLGTYRDVYTIDDHSYVSMARAVDSLVLKTRDGSRILRGNGYTYIATEQKPEGEKASFANGGVSFLSQIDRHLDRLLDQPVNVRSLTLAREELERKMAKNHDALNHRIEMLELRLDKTDSVKKPNRKPKSK